MNNKNNDGKTFDDIFSAINNDDVGQDSLKEDNKKEELNVDSSKTFNSIFDKASSMENDNLNEEKSFSDLFNNDVKNVSTVNKSNDQFFEKDKVEKEKSFSDIFSSNLSDNEDKMSFSDIFSNDIKKNDIDNTIQEKEDINLSFNTDKEEKSFSDIFSSDKKNDDKEELVHEEETNPFFSEDTEENSSSDIFSSDIKNDEKEELVHEEETNPFFSEDMEENSSSDIFSSDIKNDDKEEFVQVEEETNPFFSTEDSINEEESNNNNIVFEEVDDKKEDKELKEKVEVDNSVEKSDKGVSPFFQESVKEETNPFFNNTISLVEDSSFSNKDVNGKIDVSDVQNFDVKIRKKKPNLIQAIIGVLSYALFIWLLLVGIALLVYVLDIKIRAAKGDTSPPKYGAYVVLTGSMLPEIQVYDVVITKRQDAKDLKEGDVITFASSDSRFAGTIITHRIIKKNYSAKTKSYTFQTKGDYNNVADSALVTPSNIYGKVIFKIPKLGYLKDFLASDGGWILVILFPCLAVVSYDVVKITKGLRKKNYKNIKVQSR